MEITTDFPEFVPKRFRIHLPGCDSAFHRDGTGHSRCLSGDEATRNHPDRGPHRAVATHAAAADEQILNPLRQKNPVGDPVTFAFFAVSGTGEKPLVRFQFRASGAGRMNIRRKVITSDLIREVPACQVILPVEHIISENSAELPHSEQGTGSDDFGVLKSFTSMPRSLNRSCTCAWVNTMQNTMSTQRSLDGRLAFIMIFLRYIALDGSVFNCCVGCLSPGKGDPEDYNGRMWQRNDSHGFGPMILAYTVAESLARAGRIPLLAELLLQ